MNRSVFRSVFFILGGIFLAACQRQSQGPVVANVAGMDITLSDLRARLDETPAQYQQYVTSAEGRKQFLNLMIREKVLLAEARKAGLEHDDTYRRALAQFKEQWKRRLKEYQETLLVESYLRQLRSKDLAVTDDEVRRFYDGHAAEFEKPIEVQAGHILVSSPEDAQRVLSRLRAGEPFEKVAREMSKDPATAAKGGQLAPFRRGMLPPEFEEAAFALRPGEISGPVKTQFGFHIIKKIGQKQLPPQSFENVKEDIRARLEREKFDQWVTSKESTMGVRIDEKAMDALAEPNAGVGSPSQEP